MSLGISSDETSYYFETATRYTLKELKELDDKGSIKWYKYNSESWSLTLIGPSFEDYHGEWYVYAKATNEVGTKYVSSPKLILDCSDPAATVHPSGKELEGKANSSTAAVEGTTYWGNLQFKVHDETPVTVQDGQTVLKPDENGIYTIPADMDDNVYHNIYIRDSCGNTIFYLKNKVRWNTLAHVDTLDEQKLPHGAVLSESLPATVTVRTAASGNQSVSVPVKWDEAADYVPAAKREQHFTVTGTLDLSGTDIVVPPEQEALQTVTVEVTVAGAPQYRVTAASSENGTVTVVNATETAEDGTPLFCKDDLVMLSIAPNEGYMLSTLSINGTPASFAVEDDTYTFAQPEENVTITATFEKRNEHTITFDANGGSEPEDLPEEVTTAMPAKKVLRGSEYSLPECEFIAPEGKQFKAWEIDGTEYPVNAPVTVTADITVKALWEDAPPAHEHSYGDWSKDGTSHWHECTDDDCPNREESIKDKAAHDYTDDTDTTCNVCGYERTVTPPTHEHSYGDWRKDGTSHWHECTDDDCPNREESIKDKAAHVYGDDADTTCDVCGYERTVTPPTHEHSYGDWSKDGTSHWRECTDADCPDRNESIKDKAAHDYTDDTDTTCNVCGYERTVTPPTHEHSYGDWRKDGTSHWHECTDDDCPNREESIKDKAAHVYGDDADTTCDVCGYERTVTPPTHEHSYGDWSKDGTSHWRECTDADCPDRNESIKDKAAHVYTDDADTTCNVCGYERTVTPPSHEHSYGDWSKDGTSHWHECTDADCPDRNESIKDKAAHVYTDDADTTCNVCGYERTVTPPSHEHSYGDWSKDGTSHWHECTDADCPDRNESIKDKAAHVYDDDADTTCNVCGYERTVTPPAPTEYTITYDLAGGTAEGNPDTYTIETVDFTLKNPTKSGYTFTGWSGTGLDGENNMTVTIPTGSTGNRAYTAHWRYNGSGHSYSYYTIKATAGAGGSISPSGNVSVREGRDQTFTITPDKGYAVANVKIDGKSIGAVKSYTFENVSRTHTIEVIFMKANGNPQTGVFVDVATGSYYEDAVDWAVENGITKGTDDTHFSPDGICTRAQAVTFLWRAAGSPEPETRAMPFNDVPVGSYYYDAVLWAVENGITKGTSDTTFSPNMTCTRAQIVAFLWRSEKSPAAGTANPFADVKSTAYYADAVLWAVKENITKGTTSTTFSPNADCTRAQIVTFLWRCKK